MTARLGAIADDYTGAVDLATTLVARGHRTRVHFGVPSTPPSDDHEVDAVVIGLKTRSAPVAHAVDESRSALRALRAREVQRVYHKICATFDSTPEGNIGPVLDALMLDLGVDKTVVVLPYPEAGRTMYQGHLFVHGVRLDETSMRDHPLTPMTDSRIARLLEPQTTQSVHEVRFPDTRRGPAHLAAVLGTLEPGIAIIDALERCDLDAIAAATDSYPLVSGGAGLAASFPTRSAATAHPTPLEGRGAVLAGSASRETQAQLAFASGTLPTHKLDLPALRQDFDTEVIALRDWVLGELEAHGRAPIVYATGSADDIEVDSPTDAEPAAVLIERALGSLASALVDSGINRLIVAGGESSGSVTRALGIHSFDVSPPLSPGTAWARGRTNTGQAVDLLLKSGSLGTKEIFVEAW
ncbi:3-oxo-tetronate kinase [Microbacterium sp.]|uniref:3-oxo-tetronate kinase n=1 Tax=Microbacterium sp. TaxID=51671 RepID=UPI003A8D5096